MDDEILDYNRSKRPTARVANIFIVLSFLFFLYWFSAGFMGWRYAGVALFCGLLILLLITVVRFFAKQRRRLYSWLYFSGKMLLFAAIFLGLMHFRYASYFIMGAFGCFLSGLAVLYLNKPKG